MSNISWPNRRKSICEVFCQAYFGHVLLTKGIWQQLEQYLDTYFASIEQSRHRDETYSEAFIILVKELIFIVTKHSLNRFPVSWMHKRNVTKWLVDYLKRINSDSTLDDTLSHELSILEVIKQDGLEIEEVDPEYIFKTFVRVGPGLSSTERCYVTLLEENRDIIGHGTTGLTSWQGALFLADWFQNHQDKLEVWEIYFMLVIQ